MSRSRFGKSGFLASAFVVTLLFSISSASSGAQARAAANCTTQVDRVKAAFTSGRKIDPAQLKTLQACLLTQPAVADSLEQGAAAGATPQNAQALATVVASYQTVTCLNFNSDGTLSQTIAPAPVFTGSYLGIPGIFTVYSWSGGVGIFGYSSFGFSLGPFSLELLTVAGLPATQTVILFVLRCRVAEPTSGRARRAEPRARRSRRANVRGGCSRAARSSPGLNAKRGVLATGRPSCQGRARSEPTPAVRLIHRGNVTGRPRPPAVTSAVIAQRAMARWPRRDPRRALATAAGAAVARRRVGSGLRSSWRCGCSCSCPCRRTAVVVVVGRRPTERRVAPAIDFQESRDAVLLRAAADDRRLPNLEAERNVRRRLRHVRPAVVVAVAVVVEVHDSNPVT